MKDRDPLKVLQAARQFGVQVVELTRSLPRHAPSGLRGQLSRAGLAVGSLLAEGLGRGTTAEKIHYSRMANGSVEESQYHLRQCVNTQLIDRKTFFRLWNLSVAISHMILSLIQYYERQREREE